MVPDLHVVANYYQLPWEDVRREMVVEKGLNEGVADKIGEYVIRKGMQNLVCLR